MDGNWEVIAAAFERRVAECKSHPVPPPRNGIIPRGCTCYESSPEAKAFFGYRLPVCQICGGREHCKPWCDAADKQ